MSQWDIGGLDRNLVDRDREDGPVKYSGMESDNRFGAVRSMLSKCIELRLIGDGVVADIIDSARVSWGAQCAMAIATEHADL